MYILTYSSINRQNSKIRSGSRETTHIIGFAFAYEKKNKEKNRNEDGKKS
jgi:cysteine sulfinate desulfinase/cysteine desulfurase-like protein